MIDPLSLALEARAPGRLKVGDNCARVYLPEALTHSDYVRAALVEVRMAGAGQPYVVEAIVDALNGVHHRLHGSGYEGRCEPLLSEAQALVLQVESANLPEDVTKYLQQVISKSYLMRNHQARHRNRKGVKTLVNSSPCRADHITTEPMWRLTPWA